MKRCAFELVSHSSQLFYSLLFFPYPFMKLKEYLYFDFPAAVVVFLVALPLCLGIALASGAPLFSGLIAGIAGGIIVGTLSGSPLSVSGPAAGLTSIVLAAIHQLGFEAFLLAVVLAGVFQVVLGVVRAGAVGHFFPSAVLKGMLAAIGLTLILKQIPHASGYDVDYEGDQSFLQDDGRNTFSEIMEAWNYLTPGALVVSILSILILIAWSSDRLKKHAFFKTIPAALVVVLVGALLNLLFQSSVPALVIEQKHLVSVPILGDGQSLISLFTFPDFTQLANPKIYVTAATIAAVASIETLLNIEACDKLDPFRRITPLNRELKAQGLANVVSGLLGGLPLTSVVVRSSANIQNGARTKASAITHGVILLLAIVLIPTMLQYIPLASLAGILIVLGLKLNDPSLYKDMYRKGLDQFLPFIVTVAAVVFTNLLLGVFLGILVAVFFILKTNFQESVVLVNQGNSYLLKLTKDVSFLSKGTLRDVFNNLPHNSSLIIDGSKAQFMDNDIKDTISDFMESSKAKNIQVELKHITL
jgi:MFS superfamily sulfate permease-like transporter